MDMDHIVGGRMINLADNWEKNKCLICGTVIDIEFERLKVTEVN